MWQPNSRLGDRHARAEVRRPSALRSVATLLTPRLVLACSLLGPVAQTAAQPTISGTPRERISLNVDTAVVKKLATVRDYLDERQWTDAIDVLQQLSVEENESLAPVASGLYLNVGLYANSLMANLPAEGLAVYRQRIDPQVQRWLMAGRSRNNDQPLWNIVRYAFASSMGDQALWLLGERSWERGEIDLARRCWQQMLPLDKADKKAPTVSTFDGLRFPDTQFDPALIDARLILCAIMEGDWERVERKLRDLQVHHADSSGMLAGRNGRLAEILEHVASEARQWEYPRRYRGVATFALNTKRNGIVPHAIDVGSIQWSLPLLKQPSSAFPLQPAFDASPLSYFPVVHQDIVLVNDADHVLAYNLNTGKPAWPVDGDDNNAVIYPAVPEERHVDPSVVASGVPRFTMSLANGRLYAKMGSPVTGRSTRELRELPSQLICLDLDRGEGKLVWMVRASEFGSSGAPWAFEGSPLVVDGRAFCVLRRSRPETQINVACFNAETGELLWNRLVCATASPIDDQINFMSHQLLTHGAGSIYLSTDLGVVAALDARSGRLQWAATYESEKPESLATLSSDTEHGLVPCLYHQGTIVAAPNDSHRVMAFDALTGILKWRFELPPVTGLSQDRMRHVLGVAHGRLIVSGNSLWAIDMQTGRPAWRIQSTDPETDGYGRGILAGDVVYWPTREEIFVVDQSSGRLERRIPIRAVHGAGGGNLTIAGNLLLIAQADRLVAFSEYARKRDETPTHVTQASPTRQSPHGGLGHVNERVVGVESSSLPHPTLLPLFDRNPRIAGAATLTYDGMSRNND